MAVQYKFKSAKDFDSIPIDGQGISVAALKEKIVLKQKLGGASDFDLVLTNAETDEEYLDENLMVHDNASVLVRRVPRKASASEAGTSGTLKVDAPEAPTTTVEASVEASGVVTEQKEASEPPCITSDEDVKIKEFVDSSAADWMRLTHEAAANSRGHGSCFQRKTPPAGYVCHRCGVSGHFIQHCPTNGDSTYDVKKVKMPSGIPKTMLVADSDGTYALPNGGIAVLQPNEVAFAKEFDGLVPPEPLKEIPAELQCPLCQNALKDAVLTSKCCFKSFCDSCIRSVFLEKATCVCGAKNIRADDLLPNKTLRETVDRLLLNCSPQATISLSHKPQSQDSTTTNLESKATASNSVDGKSNEGTPASNEENEDIEEELDYDEEGLDDALNLDDIEIDDEPSASPETKPEAPEKEEPEQKQEETKQEQSKQLEKQETKEAPVTPPEPAVKTKAAPVPAKHPPAWNQRRGNVPPYAVQYTGYWSAIGNRPAYGYGGYFPPHFPPFHVQPYARSKALVSRESDARNKRRIEPDRRTRPGGNSPHQNAKGEFKQQRSEARHERPRERERSRSGSPQRSKRSISLRKTRTKRERSSSPRRAPTRRSPSPVRRLKSNNERSRSRSSDPRFIERPSPPQKRIQNPGPRNKATLQERGLRVKQRRELLRRSPELEETQVLRLRSARTSRNLQESSPEAPLYRIPPRFEEFEEEVEERRWSFGARDDVPEKRERILQGARVVVQGSPPPERTRSVLRAARGVEMEPGNGMDTEDFRRLLLEFEQSKRPVVRAPAMARKRSLMTRGALIRRRAPEVDEDDEVFEDEVEEYELLQQVMPVQRTAVFRRPEGRVEAGFGSEDDQLTGEFDEEDEDGDEMLVSRAGRRRRKRAQKQKVAAAAGVVGGSDDEDEFCGDGVIPQKRGLKKSLLARLNLGNKKLKVDDTTTTTMITTRKNRPTPVAQKSVFERISFSSKGSSGAGGGSCGTQISNAGGGAPRMVVFYGDV